MFKFDRKPLGDRDKELFLGHIVTWGSLVFALAAAITLAGLSSPETDGDAASSRVEAAPDIIAGEKG